MKLELNYQEGGIVSKVLLKGQQNVTLFSMGADTEITPHTSTKAGFVFVIEGKGSFNLEGKEIGMTAGVLIEMNAGAVHSLTAEENTSFLLVLGGTK